MVKNLCWSCGKDAIGFVEIDNGKNQTGYALCNKCIDRIEKDIKRG